MNDAFCNKPPAEPVSGTARGAIIQHALRLEWLTAGWMTVEAAVAIGAGVVAHSLTLVAFGIDSVIELLSAGVLLWRLIVELKRGGEFPERVEQRASRIGGALLFALAIYVVASAAWSLWNREGQAFSTTGLILAAVAMPVMYFLARSKLRIAEEIGSRALRADAVESIACGYLSLVVVAGLAAQWLFDAWWIDGVGALVLVPLLVREAREAWDGEDCCA